jgi:hypothetical protein
MPRKRHSAEEIVAKLRQADVLLAQGQTGADVARVLGVTETSCVMSCSTARSSTYCEKRKSSSNNGADTTMRSVHIHHSAIDHLHRKSSSSRSTKP